jgi:predicted  nucleic acid-binding Zn-ribbon protein
MHPDLEKLIQLQETERQIRYYLERIELLPKKLADLGEKLDNTLRSLKSNQDRLSKLALDKRRLEGTISDLEQKSSKYRVQLVDVKTNEQYKALLHEIEFNTNQVRKIEDEILVDMEEEEKLRKEAIQIERQLQRERALVETEKKAAEEAVEQDRAILAKLQNQRQSLMQSIDPKVLEIYTRIARFRKGVALAKATEDSCQACHVRIRPHVLSQVISGNSIVTCDSCHRILYWKAEAPYEVSP